LHKGSHAITRGLDPDASLLLGLSVRTLQKWRLQGNGPRFLKLGQAVRYDPADLDDYISRARRTSTSDPGRDRRDPELAAQNR
jgi:hypothetical protein